MGCPVIHDVMDFKNSLIGFDNFYWKYVVI